MHRVSIFIFLFLPIISFSQNKFNIAGVYGNGFTIPSAHSIYTEPNKSKKMKSALSVIVGTSVQYVLGDKFGIETGITTSIQAYLSKNKTYSLRNIDSYVPIQLLYKINYPRNPFKKIIIIAGPSLHWTNALYSPEGNSYNEQKGSMLDLTKTVFNPCLALGIKIGKEQRKGGRVEYGLDYQYSVLGRSLLPITNFNNTQQLVILNTRISLLSFKFYYFLIHRKIKTNSSE